VVVTGRVTDASLVVGPGIWAFGWDPSDVDEQAGGVVAGGWRNAVTFVLTGGQVGEGRDS